VAGSHQSRSLQSRSRIGSSSDGSSSKANVYFCLKSLTRIKFDRIKCDRINFDRIKSDRIKTNLIKSITDPSYFWLKGPCHKIFYLGFFSSNNSSGAPDPRVSSYSRKNSTMKLTFLVVHCKKRESYLPQESVWVAGGPTPVAPRKFFAIVMYNDAICNAYIFFHFVIGIWLEIFLFS
jgi:hypothetical protein